MARKKNYTVGFGKPPKQHQFKKGQSGNPKGRPPGTKNFETELREVLDSPITVNRDGRTQTISVKKAALLKLSERSLSGNVPAMRVLIDLIRSAEAQTMEEVASDLSRDDAQILEQFANRIRQQSYKEKIDEE